MFPILPDNDLIALFQIETRIFRYTVNLYEYESIFFHVRQP